MERIAQCQCGQLRAVASGEPDFVNMCHCTECCPNCGSSVYWDADLRADYYGIAVGAFADPGFPASSASVWEQSMHYWAAAPQERSIIRRGGGAPRPGNSPGQVRSCIGAAFLDRTQPGF
jgi:hypothetical protein